MRAPEIGPGRAAAARPTAVARNLRLFVCMAFVILLQFKERLSHALIFSKSGKP